jgi:hypothetical protein
MYETGWDSIDIEEETVWVFCLEPAKRGKTDFFGKSVRLKVS